MERRKFLGAVAALAVAPLAARIGSEPWYARYAEKGMVFAVKRVGARPPFELVPCRFEGLKAEDVFVICDEHGVVRSADWCVAQNDAYRDCNDPRNWGVDVKREREA